MNIGYETSHLHPARFVPKKKLEQLERMLSEHSPRCPMLTHTILDLNSKQDNVKVTNLKNQPKCITLEFCITLSSLLAFWSCFIRCVNIKLTRLLLWKLQSGQVSVHRRADGRTDRRTTWIQYSPFKFVEVKGIFTKSDSCKVFRTKSLLHINSTQCHACWFAMDYVGTNFMLAAKTYTASCS